MSYSLPSSFFALQEKKHTVLRALCLGDVVGNPGRKALKDRLSLLKQQHNVDICIANGENSAGGIGITPATAKELHSSGAEIITTGNHVWRHQSVYALLEQDKNIIRPANYPEGAPGKGVVFYNFSKKASVAFSKEEEKGLDTKGDSIIAVINLLGRVYMGTADCPFATVDKILSSLPENVRMVIVDFHAEATSEKRAMAHHLDGRVSAVFGTHTHVQTADAMILPKGTAQLTDLGMCGAEESSVIGMKPENVITRFVTGMPKPFVPATGKISLNGAFVDIDRATGKAIALTLLREII